MCIVSFGLDSRIPAIVMSDGRGISSVTVKNNQCSAVADSVCDFKITLHRDFWSGMPKEWNAKCGWTSPSPTIYKVNGVLTEISEDVLKTTDKGGEDELSKPNLNGLYNNYTAEGLILFRHHRYDAPQGFSGSFVIDGTSFDVADTTEADIVDFYELVFKKTKKVSCIGFFDLF